MIKLCGEDVSLVSACIPVLADIVHKGSRMLQLVMLAARMPCSVFLAASMAVTNPCSAALVLINVVTRHECFLPLLGLLHRPTKCSFWSSHFSSLFFAASADEIRQMACEYCLFILVLRWFYIVPDFRLSSGELSLYALHAIYVELPVFDIYVLPLLQQS